MNLTTENKEFTPDEKVAATLGATKVMIEYMGNAKTQSNRIKLLIILDILLLSSLMGFLAYQAFNPPSTEIDRKWIIQQQNNIMEQRDAIKIRDSHDSAIAAKNTQDAIINLNAQKALAIDRADIAKARSEVLQTLKSAVTKDSLSSQKKIVNVKTVNAENVNTKSVNIRKK